MTIRKINSRTSFGVGLLPTCVRTREISLQYIRKPVRCQRTTVSGVTDDEGLLPSRPDPSSDYPEELIEEAKARSRMSTLQHGELLPEHEILQNKIPAATEKANQGSDPEEKQTEHGKEL
jgi:hypothetical protein